MRRMDILLVVSLLLIINLPKGNGQPAFVLSTPPHINVVSGTSTTITWTYSSVKNIVILFVEKQATNVNSFSSVKSTSILLGGTVFIDAGTYPTSVQSRYSASLSQSSNKKAGSVSLTISNVQCEDVGKLRTSGSSANGPGNGGEVTLGLLVPPQINPSVTAPIPPSGQTLADGQTVNITCSGDVGNPGGTFEWKRVKNAVSSSPLQAVLSVIPKPATCSSDGTSTLTRVLSKEDNGASYQCTTKPDSSVGTLTSVLSATTGDLIVAYGVTIFPTTDSITVVKTESSTLTCNADGNPTPAYSWTMGGQTLTGETASTYTIQADAMAVQKNLIYVCMASNTVNGAGYNVSKTFSVSITDESTDDKIDMAVVGGAVGGGVAFLILVVVIVVVCMKMKKPKPTPERGGHDTDPENSYSEHKNNAHENEYMDDSKPDLIGGNNFDSPKHRNVEGIVYADLALDNRARSRMPIQAPAPSPTEYAEIQRRP